MNPLGVISLHVENSWRRWQKTGNRGSILAQKGRREGSGASPRGRPGRKDSLPRWARNKLLWIFIGFQGYLFFRYTPPRSCAIIEEWKCEDKPLIEQELMKQNNLLNYLHQQVAIFKFGMWLDINCGKSGQIRDELCCAMGPLKVRGLGGSPGIRISATDTSDLR